MSSCIRGQSAAAIAGRCVFKQNSNAFWDYHDWIFEHQAEITVENLTDKVLEFAKGKEIDPLQLSRCIETKATEPEVAKRLHWRNALRVDSTPTLFINGRRRVGSQDWPTLRTIIDYEIEYQKTAHNAGEDCGCSIQLGVPGPIRWLSRIFSSDSRAALGSVSCLERRASIDPDSLPRRR